MCGPVVHILFQASHKHTFQGHYLKIQIQPQRQEIWPENDKTDTFEQIKLVTWI